VDYSGGTMTPIEEMAERISRNLPNIKQGTLRLWGRSFGRPGEDWHVLQSCGATPDCVRFHFIYGDVLAVWNPVDVEINDKTFRIRSASAMRLSWYARSPKIPENIRYRDYALVDGSVAFRTNVDTIPGSGWLEQDAAASFPAVQMSD
jgi:hypothetical protein